VFQLLRKSERVSDLAQSNIKAWFHVQLLHAIIAIIAHETTALGYDLMVL